jgi:hypothetical protein
MLIGKAGFQALLARSLALAERDSSWLHAVRVNPDGSLLTLGELPTQLSAKEIAEGGVDLITELLGLLIAFIGEQLTWHLMHDVWPQLPPHAFDLSRGSRHET